MSRINIFLVDNLNNIKEEKNIIKPRTYRDLTIQLKQNLNNMPDYYEIYLLDKNNKKININNEEIYKKIEDVLFIKGINKDILEQSMFEINYDKLSESKQNILDQKYNCQICSMLIKNENPYLCYKCQNIFHEKCLKEWDKKCKEKNKNLMCPFCRNELAIERWNKKLDYEENRNDDANIMNKINELKENEMKQKELIKKYEIYIEKTIEIFKNILNKIVEIRNLMKLSNNNKLNYFINLYPLNINNLINIDDISNLINEEFVSFEKYISNNNEIINKFNNNSLEKKKNEVKKINEYKNKINIKYFVESKGICNIFGEKFVERNKNNIELFINNKKNELINKYELKEGKNIITIIIKNKLTDLSYMFYNCKFLQDISELKYLDVSESKDFSYMFYKCSSLSDIEALENWNVSNGNNFESIFSECSLLSNIKALENWNVSNSNNFSDAFFECTSLSNIKPLKNWDVSNCKYFNNMFRECSSLSNIEALENWNVSSGSDFVSLFSGCELLSDIKPLENWNVSNGIDFGSMFYGCISLSNINPLKYWNVSKGIYFTSMFYGCSLLSDINPLQNWNISNGKYFSNMFAQCSSLSDIQALQKWNFCNFDRIKGMFFNCSSSVKKSLLNWNIPSLIILDLISKDNNL